MGIIAVISITVTSYRKIYNLLYIYLQEKKESAIDRDEGYFIDDNEFFEIVKDTEFTEYEVRDALESLVDEGMV